MVKQEAKSSLRPLTASRCNEGNLENGKIYCPDIRSYITKKRQSTDFKFSDSSKQTAKAKCRVGHSLKILLRRPIAFNPAPCIPFVWAKNGLRKGRNMAVSKSVGNYFEHTVFILHVFLKKTRVLNRLLIFFH